MNVWSSAMGHSAVLEGGRGDRKSLMYTCGGPIVNVLYVSTV